MFPTTCQWEGEEFTAITPVYLGEATLVPNVTEEQKTLDHGFGDIDDGGFHPHEWKICGVLGLLVSRGVSEITEKKAPPSAAGRA